MKNGIPEYTIVKGVAWDHLLLTSQLIEVVEQADAICYGTLALRYPRRPTTPSSSYSSTPSRAR